jgi:hypothetical protein
VEELTQAQHRVGEQDELEKELEVVRQLDAGSIQHLCRGNIIKSFFHQVS